MDNFGKYQLLRRLGAGGMAEVFLAKEPLAGGLAKILVIKKIHPALAETPQFRQMFEDEAKVGVNLNHPNVVQTFGYGQIGPTFYLAMEFIEGVDLLRLLNSSVEQKSPIPFGLSAYVGQQVAKGLDYAHRKTDEYGEAVNIVHRDISPQNILVSVDGAVKIVDFGIARARHVREEEGVVKGKFAYMSPEQAGGEMVDPRSDVFSVGIVLWELVVGRSLFGHLKGKQALNAIRTAEVPRPQELVPTLPLGLEQIIMKALEKKPEERFQTARDLHRALGTFIYEQAAQHGELYESGALARVVAQLVPKQTLSRPDSGTGSGQSAHGSRPGRTPEPSPPTPASGALPITERRHVVVVEGIVGGLTQLRHEMGEQRARAALLDFLRVCENVAYKHGGHADRLDERGFTYILGLPVGTEDDPTRSVHLAASLTEALDAICRELDPMSVLERGRATRLELQIGVQRGVALVSRTPGSSKFEYELVGRTGAIATRLASEALAGEILVGGGVFRSARTDWRFEELQPIEIPPDADPGSSHSNPIQPHDTQDGYEPVPTTAPRSKVYRLLGGRPRAERLAGAPGGLELVGRDAELGTLQQVHATVRRLEEARHVLILGEAGVGKRSVVEAFRRSLDPSQHLILRAVARPSLRDTPYALVADLNRDLLGVGEEADPREVRRRLDAAIQRLFRPDEQKDAQRTRDALALLLGVKAASDEELDPGERRHRLQQAMRMIESRLAESEGRTLVVAIEDLHWADQQSFEVLASLVLDPLARRVLGVATARTDEKVSELARSPLVTTILLGELPTEARQHLVAQRFEDTAESAPLVARILERAGGNPFYIQELIESLLERGVLGPVTTLHGERLRWLRREEDLVVPTTVEATVASRLDRLPDDERDALRRAALLGRTFRIEDLQALVGSDPLPQLARLAARGLITPASASGDVYRGGPGAYAFRNSITRDVAYGGLAPDGRALLHSVAADRLRHSVGYRPGADDARLAEHLLEAGDRPAAGRALVQAGLYARDNAGHSEAWRLFERALRLLPVEAHRERYVVHSERAQILRAWGKRPAKLREIHAMRKIAVAAADRRLEVDAQTRLGMFYLDAGKHAAARRELDQALKLARELGDKIVESEALRLQALLFMNIGRNAEAAQLAQQALAAASDETGAAGDRERLLARAQALNAVGNVHVHTGRLSDAVDVYAEALVIYRRLGVRGKEAATLNNLGWVFVGLAEYEEALVHYKRSLRIAQELGDRASIGVRLANLGQTYSDLGDLDRARRYLQKALELHQALNDQSGTADALISLAQVSLRDGQVAQAAADLERGLELAGRVGNRYQEIRALVYLAFSQLARGDGPDGPLQLARSATRLAREAGIANGEAYGLAAESAALLRAHDSGGALARALEAVALIDSGRDIDSPEEILRILSEAATAAGDGPRASAALQRAFDAVQRKARRLRNSEWRERYLGAEPARRIVGLAEQAGLVFSENQPIS